MRDDHSAATALAALLECRAPTDGSHETAIPGVHAIRLSQPSDELVFALQQPSMCLIAQGSKRVLLGNQVYRYDASHFLVYSVELPVAAEVIEASPAEPYLCFQLDIDPALVADLMLQSETTVPSAPEASERGLFLCRTGDAMLDAVGRLLRLLDTPADLPTLAPLAVREILYRLLRSPEGGRLANIAQAGGHVQRVSRAVTWLKMHFAEPMSTKGLAEHAGMSISALHQHFKSVTSMSPLQYQKQLRLQEARRLLFGAQRDIASAAFHVGYESPSQFTREYSRTFGMSPSRDLARLRSASAALPR